MYDLKDIMGLYQEWRDDPEYYCMHGTLRDMSKFFVDWYKDNLPLEVYKFVLASKRGNDVYRYLVTNKLKPLMELENVHFFSDDWGDKTTNILFVTLTYDTKRSDPDQAWHNVGSEFHLFCNNLRKQYDKIEIFRTWESTDNYYPHVHALIAFRDHSFPVFTHKDKIRISTKDRDKIKSYWHSHVDIQGISDTQGAINELVKYVTKDLCSRKGDKTNSMIWLHRKQSYSVSKHFVQLIKGCFAEVEGVQPNALLNIEMCNCNSSYYIWEFIGILRGVDLRLGSDLWVVDTDKPPPRVLDMLEYEHTRWLTSRGGC